VAQQALPKKKAHRTMATTQHNLLPSTAPVALSSSMDNEIKSFFNLDRYLGDTMTLPYSFSEVKIKSNDLCVSDNINAALYKLYYNFLYMNAETKLASNIFPSNYRGFVASNATSASADVGIYNNYASGGTAVSGSSTVGVELLNTNGTVLSGLVDGVSVKSLGTDDVTCIFTANSGTLLATRLTDNDHSANLVLHTKTIEDATGLVFNNIKSLAMDSEKKLFILDSTNIYKLDVDSLLTSNKAISSVGRFLIKTIGGKSVDIYDKDKFNTPVSIDIGNDKLYVLDIKDNGYKVYDNNLNWISTVSQKTNLAAMSGTPVNITTDPSNDNVYILSTGGTINQYDSSNKLTTSTNIDDVIEIGETFIDIAFSQVDSNVMYLLSNKNIYKKFKSKIARSIGVFRLSDNSITGERFTFINVNNNPGSLYDDVYVGGESVYAGVKSDIGKIFKFKEQIHYQTTAYDRYKTSAYSMSSIAVDSEEYVSSWVVNKSINKLIYNHILFKENVFGKFVGTYELTGRIKYDNVQFIADTDINLFNYNTTLNNYIGINEPVLAETLNRTLQEVYDIQTTLLAVCSEKYTNKFPLATQVVTVP
jgi:hypothetical protein